MAEDNKLRGRIDIDTDDEGLLAILHFIPDSSGNEYDLSSVNRLIAEKQISYGLDRDRLNTGLAGLFEKQQEITITIAEGDPAEAAKPEKKEWAPVSIPEEMKEDVTRFLQNAAPPEIYDVRVEKQKKEKLVKKKGILPFGKEKEEKVVETVSLEKKVKVDVVPDVLEAGWVEENAKIADLTKGEPGKPGKDVFGRPIPAVSTENEFWLGQGIQRKADTLIASETGILRRGWNWVEVLPFKSHDWSIELTGDKNTCLFNFNPGGAELSPPDPAEIIRRAGALGCSEESLVSEARLSEIISNAVSSGRPLKRSVISTDDDGFFEIRVSEDRLKAELVLHKARGDGQPLVLKQIGAAIKASGLKGMDLKKIQETILEFYKGPETDFTFTLAEGTPPEEGEAGDITFELEFLKDEQVADILKRAAALDEDYLSKLDSAADFPPTTATRLAFVQENQKVALLPAAQGQKGRDVYGADLEASAADSSEYRVLENVKIDGTSVVSTTKGLLECFEQDDVTAFRIRAHRDAKLSVRVSSDKMEAVLIAEPGIGTGAPPSLEEANRVLAEAGVTNGISAEDVRKVVDRCRDGESVAGEVVARGKEPVNAGDARLKMLVDLADGQAVSIDEKGRANYRKQNRFTSVKDGDRLAEIHVVQGISEDGWDVAGNKLTAKQASQVDLQIGANIREEKDDQGNVVLFAEKSGRIIYENNKLEIQENLFVKGDVDFGSGNIKFGGDVNVKGNVKSGFFVMAGGNISIGMNSEMSLLSSEKSIMVAQGIKGGGKAILRAKECIQMSFAERATLLAVEDITVKNAIFGCKVKCNGKLRLMTEKGFLVGGRIQARRGIEAANIGSISGSRTEVSFGQDYLISDRIETEEKEIEKIKARLVKIDSEMRMSEKSGDRNQLTKLRQEKVKLMKILEKRSMRVFALKERFEQHFPGDVLIRGEVFPGVVFESHGRTLEITGNEKALKIVFNQETGMLEKIPLSPSDTDKKE